MARKKSSPAEDLLGLLAMLPWWVGVVLAVISYVVLHRLAIQTTAPLLQPGQGPAFALRTIGTMLASVGQYLLPPFCFVAAVISFLRRRRRKTLVNDVAGSTGASSLDGISWREFEMLVGEAFRLQGFRVAEIGGGGPDGGVDLKLTKGTEKHYVQCKQWKAYKVGVDVVRQLYGVMAAEGAAGGFVVTSGTFTKDAQEFASGRNVKLLDGQRLFGMIKQARESLQVQPGRNFQERSPTRPVGEHKEQAQVQPAADLPCPICASAMVKRTAQRGANAGSQFWGCLMYPKCRGTRAVS
jgi:restriction system protein